MSNNCETSSDLDSSKIRFYYIWGILEKLLATKTLLPDPNEAQLYQEALGHLVHVLLTKVSPVVHAGYGHNCKNDWCAKKGLNKREEKMGGILNKLKCLERKRLYDPPSDNEIGYYHLIKKYIRSMGIFFSSQKGLAGLVHERFDCVTSMLELRYLEELEEGNLHLEQFSAYLKDMNDINGCDVKHLLGISEIPVQPVIINGSKERNNLFYFHKFRLALLDLISSHYAFTRPYPQEKKCYDQLLAVPPSQVITREVSVYSDHLWYQFYNKVVGNIINLDKHCAHVGSEILAKLSIPVSWESLSSLCTEYGLEEDEALLSFINESLEKCTQMQDQVKDVDRFIKIAHYIREFLCCLGEMKMHVAPHMDTCHRPNDTSDPYSVLLDWQALHAFTLFNNGSSFPVNELREKEMVPGGLEPCSKKKTNLFLKEEDENGNVAMLKAILDEIRMIGDWHFEPLPTCKEDEILVHICRHVTSSTHFFLSAMAYEERTRVIQHGGLNVRRTSRKRKREDKDPLIISVRSIVRRWEALISLLEGYKDGLLEKLNNSHEFN